MKLAPFCTSLIMFVIVADLPASTLVVGKDYKTIQSAIDAAGEGDTVLVNQGIYKENLRIEGKTLTLASRYLLKTDSSNITGTIIDGMGKDIPVLNVAGHRTVTLVGLTITNGDDGVYPTAPMHIRNCHIYNTGDGIDYESGSGGTLTDCLIERNRDDAVDFDEDVNIVVERNILRNNDDDGIELRLHPWKGDTLTYTIRNNIISGNGEDGLQFIWYNVPTNRRFIIESNLFVGNEMAAIACMNDSNTVEDFRGAQFPESASIRWNTIESSPVGISGGANFSVTENYFSGCSRAAFLKCGASSVIENNILWNNKLSTEGCSLDVKKNLIGTPHPMGRPMVKNKR